MNSFGEDLAVKTRRPYTITKQREKWTEEEHNRFLEALKLYGRAWQRIEEHIGTKTAIQIRSHAQKFFTKLEKEAVATGTPLGQAHDIDIPPPRPKKKPNYPYPRKTGFFSIPPPTEAAEEKTLKTMNPLPQATNKQDLRFEKNLMQEASVAAKSLQETKECSDEGHCSVVLNLFQDAPSASIPSMDRSSKNQFSFREYVPMATQPKEPPFLKGSSPTIEVNMESTLSGMTESDQALGRENEINIELPASLASSGKGETSGAQKQAKKQSESDHEQGDGSEFKSTVENGGSPSSASPLMNHTSPEAPAFHTSSTMSYISHPFPTFPPFAQFQSTQDFYRSLLGISSTFSSQIVSTLLQNPQVHAAACMAASIWPSEEMDSSSMAATAAATVAAASAWWATNGLIPCFPPLHAPGFAFSSPAASSPVVNTGQSPQEKMEERHETYLNSSSSDQQTGCPERLKALETQNSPSKSLISSSSSSPDLEKIKKDISNFNNLKPLFDAAYHNLDEAKISKQERSSCGSNTTSSSEIETGAVLKNNGETKDEVKQALFQNLPAGEVNTRRARSSLCFNETWKEVSQEGRQAFQALFTRDILPQSFTAQFAKSEMGLPKEGMPTGRDEAMQNCSLPNEIKLGNLKVRRTGFKPYKRCSAEVEVRKSSANDETSNKKIRLEAEASS